jgi:hypothetical protein
MTLQIDENVAPVEVRINRCHYNAHCRARNCRARGILVACYLDSMGRFLRQFELCAPHTDRLVVRDRRRGIVVTESRDD